MDGAASGGEFDRPAVTHRPPHLPRTALIPKIEELRGCGGGVTLLAASTLAQMASMAALSSRRRAFFSLALLDFLWGGGGTKGNRERGIKASKPNSSSHPNTRHRCHKLQNL